MKTLFLIVVLSVLHWSGMEYSTREHSKMVKNKAQNRDGQIKKEGDAYKTKDPHISLKDMNTNGSDSAIWIRNLPNADKDKAIIISFDKKYACILFSHHV